MDCSVLGYSELAKRQKRLSDLNTIKPLPTVLLTHLNPFHCSFPMPDAVLPLAFICVSWWIASVKEKCISHCYVLVDWNLELWESAHTSAYPSLLFGCCPSHPHTKMSPPDWRTLSPVPIKLRIKLRKTVIQKSVKSASYILPYLAMSFTVVPLPSVYSAGFGRFISSSAISDAIAYFPLIGATV